MKNIIAILFFTSCIMNAQQENLKNTITASGSCTYQIEAVEFRAKTTLSLAESAYSGIPCSSLEEMKKNYFKELDAKGISRDKVTEKKATFLSTGRAGAGTTMEFITDDITEMEAYGTLKISGMYGSNVDFKYKAKEDEATIIEKALANSKANATKLAAAADKKVGKIVFINSGYQTPQNNESFEYFQPEGRYSVTVTYELVD